MLLFRMGHGEKLRSKQSRLRESLLQREMDAPIRVKMDTMQRGICLRIKENLVLNKPFHFSRSPLIAEKATPKPIAGVGLRQIPSTGKDLRKEAKKFD